MLITKTIERDMWHRLLDHASKCHNVHWHRYKAEITLEWEIKNHVWDGDNGMVVDFSDIKSIAKDFIDSERDHGYMFQQGDVIGDMIVTTGLKWIMVDFPPTAECIVMELFARLESLYKSKFINSVMLVSIKLWETPTSYVEYYKK